MKNNTLLNRRREGTKPIAGFGLTISHETASLGFSGFGLSHKNRTFKNEKLNLGALARVGFLWKRD